MPDVCCANGPNSGGYFHSASRLLPIAGTALSAFERREISRRADRWNRSQSRKVKRIFVALLVLAAVGAPRVDAASAPRDWSQTAIDDLHFIRAILRENHPGPADPENPRFMDWYRRGFEEALDRARKAKSFAGYFFSVGYYMAGFRDGHLGALVERHIEDHLAEKRLDRKWPRFVVGYEEGRFVVTNVHPSLHGVPLPGDRLSACDGRPADDWAREVIGDYSGLWFLPGERGVLAPLLAIDEGNPFVRPPDRCTFQPASGGRAYVLRLQWTPTTGQELLAALPRTRSPQPGMRRAGADQTAFWITIPSLALGDPATGAALKTLTEDVRAAAAEIRASRAVVFDVRRNRGGSSEAGRALLAAIWGTPPSRARSRSPPPSTGACPPGTSASCGMPISARSAASSARIQRRRTNMNG